MCGFAGFTGFKNNAELAAMANRIQQHRGPDNQSVWSDDFISLAHQRLSIIDLSERSNQPLHKGDYAIVFNGEIYNYVELKEKLIKEKQVAFDTTGDTEVALEMFINYGVASFDQLGGMFAFAIYNKVTHDLIIARDHFGIKPLFYTFIESGFAFSSELKTLVRIPGFNKSLNKKALVSCLNYLWVSGNESMFANCFKLPAAHYISYNGSREFKMVKYWELEESAGTKSSDENRIVQELSETIQESITRHMVADVPVSSFLSGGLDSSLISVLAKRSNPNLSTYTISTIGRDKQVEKMPDDEKYAQLLADEFKLDHHVIEISSDIIKMLPEMVKTLDEPIGDPAAINTFIICRAARERGVKVLLSGMGADEIFFGYRRQKATLLSMKFNRLPLFVRKSGQIIADMLPVKIGNKGFRFGRWAKRFFSFVSLPPSQTYMRSYSYYSPDQLQNLVTTPYKEAVNLLVQEHDDIFNSKYQGDIVNQMCNTDLSMFMLGLNLTYTDRASMAASVEVRVPFIDKKVIEKAMQIPGKFKIYKNQSKYILKKVAESFLPKSIIYRPKAAFGAPIRSWISSDLKAMVDDLLSKENIEKRGVLNYNVVQKLIENDRKGLEDNAYQIYQLLTVELWFREYLDK
ncbi:asparagine synthase (glutamine-hydrolyzing) [Flavihumibacter fluvii]|uniref:asparagine synthase (glutamine-hydrolyzing) n=1 Tax=Flavihumibacter fluvii TaxID=2838157 RepID=UPI001BDF4132|nr:asparagine synthase (glutamine-hydrolyzing) [Flavihumibacter fluvii]ULQ54433.1 asparagine synthase (glutamine-hydrolyzing) [Flavihumibacter fluvii]